MESLFRKPLGLEKMNKILIRGSIIHVRNNAEQLDYP